MHQWISFMAVASVYYAQSTEAAPAPITNDYTKIHQVAGKAWSDKTGHIALERIYRKYQWPLPPDLQQAAANDRIAIQSPSDRSASSPSYAQTVTQGKGNTVGSITVYPAESHAEYLAPITIGGQTLQLDIDTGSSDLWIFNTDLPAQERSTHNLYDPTKSRTYKDRPDMTFLIEYGDDTSTKGQVAMDTVQIGGIAVPGQMIELPETVSGGITNDQADGILGLAFGSLSSIQSNGQANPQPTWFENALPRLANPLFTANLKIGTTGGFNFGEIDHTAYRDTLKYVALDNSTGYWGFQSASYAVGGGNIQTNSGSHMAIADTGASLFYLDPAVVNAYYANVEGKSKNATTNMMTFPCTTQLPDFHVAIGDDMVAVPGHMLNWKAQGDGRCIGGIQSNDGNPPQVYGDILFQLFFFVFDYGNRRIGYAPHA